MSFGGKYNYAKEYAKYRPKQPDSIFEQYVDETPDLLAAWNQIQDDPSGTQASYWKPRGASSKAAFGRAHAAEDSALAGGTYQGGTDVSPWTTGTRFEGFLDTLSVPNTTPGDTPARPGFNPYLGDNPNFPLLETAYTSPSAPSWTQSGGGLISDAYAPWVGGNIPDNIWQGEGPIQGLGYGVQYSAPTTVQYSAPTTGPITIPVQETETTSGGSGTTTDAQGNKWVITPGGQWISADSDYAQALAADNAAYYQHYDQSGAYIGGEGHQPIFNEDGDITGYTTPSGDTAWSPTKTFGPFGT